MRIPKSPKSHMQEYSERIKQNKKKEKEIGISSEEKAHRKKLDRRRVANFRSNEKKL